MFKKKKEKDLKELNREVKEAQKLFYSLASGIMLGFMIAGLIFVGLFVFGWIYSNFMDYNPIKHVEPYQPKVTDYERIQTLIELKEKGYVPIEKCYEEGYNFAEFCVDFEGEQWCLCKKYIPRDKCYEENKTIIFCFDLEGEELCYCEKHNDTVIMTIA